jgi:hypothetical protein
MALPLDGSRTPFPVAHSPYDERDGQFAPNGHWIAYEANESGRSEIYLQTFPQPTGPKTRVSIAGGTQARWRSDGKELFFLSPDNRLTVAPVQWSGDGQPVVGTPVPLFQTPLALGGGALRQQYVVSPDGQRFLINSPADEAVATPITVLQNWRP